MERKDNLCDITVHPVMEKSVWVDSVFSVFNRSKLIVFPSSSLPDEV